MAHSDGIQIVAIQKISVKNVILAASAIGTFQAVIWMILSLIAILYYNSAIIIGNALSRYDYELWIYHLYLGNDNVFADSVYSVFNIHPKSFNIFMYFYLILSFAWLLVSCYLIWAMVREKWDYVKNLMASWSAVTFSIAALDIVLMSLIAADLEKAQDISNSIISPPPLLIMDQKNVYTSMGIVMTAAARGYILWIVNVVFAIIFVVLVHRMKKQEEQSMLPPIIDAYAAGPRPLNLYDSTDIGAGNWNIGFQPDENIIYRPSRNGELPSENFDMFRPAEPSGSGTPRSGPTRPDSYPRPLEVAPAAQRLAKIGKSTPGHRSPPLNVPVPQVPNGPQMPYIPPPDYTPPASPNSKPRSVLRPKSNYVLENN
ncbi:unnamed protein product [Phaedon cochleariae]|uniref:Uncharacterized protein n=1 Tax=Phaedon cochleariae TaxID=80249 RepID=A0A9P0GNH6_PHACE|nr:unnamed protein product [Phaedon cochleariae]